MFVPSDRKVVCGEVSVQEAGGARGGVRALLGLQSKGRRSGGSRDDACEHHWRTLLFAFFPVQGGRKTLKTLQVSSGSVAMSSTGSSLPPALTQLSPDLEVTHDLF